MKNIIAILGLLATTMVSAQVIIGDEIGTATDKTSVLLEFSNKEPRGIVLPYLKQMPTSPAEGTIILDASNPTKAKVKYYKGTWEDLSLDEGDVRTALTNQADDITTNGVIIGSDMSSAKGVLVLESTNKAMVLPKVSSVDAVVNPAPGMMVYVSNAKDKLLAIFNGSKWSFWSM